MNWHLLLALSVAPVGCALSVGSTGCSETKYVAPVTVVPTHTPGVAFVVVRPNLTASHSSRTQPGDGKPIAPNTQYLLLCDGRPVDGMYCGIPTEAAVTRYSYAPRTGNAQAPVDEGIGTLGAATTVQATISDGASEQVAPTSGSNPATAPAAGSAAAASTGSKGGQP
jgi:hypothetical protein